MTLDTLGAALADRYTIERELGAGGMATVFLAQDIKHGRKVAVKVLRPELAAVIGAERFLAEIKTTANLQHPHILPLFDSGQADSYLFYVMPYIEGVSLRDRITREHQLPVDDAVRIASEVASALDYAHRHGVIHRDIKPENILLHDGSALVADFGIALAVSTAGTRMTETGMSLGTPHYMSPEQAMGEREIGPRSDVYALGCVTYEMLVGEPPFTGPTAQAIIARVMTEEPRQLTIQRKSVPLHVDAAVLHALEKLPADRFATAAEFATALSGHGPAITTRATTSAPAQTAGSRIWRRRFLVACAGVAVVAALAAWGWIRARAATERPVERHYITLGDSVELQTIDVGPPLALSPDGSMLAFVGDTLGRLWIKRRDRLEPVLLAGTERATSPTFSPDGRWLAYTAGHHLKKVRVDGGASVTLDDSTAANFGVAWLDDGTLVYPTTSLLGLRRISASGGPASVVLDDSVFNGLGSMLPTPLPHGRGILFRLCTSGCERTSLQVLDLRSGRHKLLLNDVVMGWYLPTGYLLYLRRDGDALLARFDLSALQIRGAAVPVLQGVGAYLAGVPLTWSQSGRLVYATGSINTDIVTLEQETFGGTASVFDPSWSGPFNSFAIAPDGRRAAVSVTTPGAGTDIWIKQLDRGTFTRLTFSGRDRRPAWSPDGLDVAFVRDSSSGGDVYMRSADGAGSDRRLTHLDRPLQEVFWSHNGRWLLVRTETAARGNGDIIAVPTTGDTTTVPVTSSPFTELQPALSPDGRWVAYVSNESGAGEEVFVRPFPQSDAGRWQVSNGGGGSPVWSADGKELFFLDPAGRMIAAQLGPGPTFSVAGLKQLFDARRFTYDGFHQAFDVTKDGRFIFLGPAGLAQAQAPRLVAVDNWFADLKAKLKP
ncbi:MAG: protein kinase domain-containing protein [Gemmatimonadales bacterium]